MPFTINCTNKGCGKFQQPFLDPDDNKVYCSECEKEITNLTSFAKNQMKSFKQFKEKKKSSFSVRCDKCGKTERPSLKGKDVLCGGCQKPLTSISEAFKLMLRESLKNVDKDA